MLNITKKLTIPNIIEPPILASLLFRQALNRHRPTAKQRHLGLLPLQFFEFFLNLLVFEKLSFLILPDGF